MLDFDFDALDDDKRCVAELMEREIAAATELGPGFEALSAAADNAAWCGSGLVLDRSAEPVVICINTHIPGLPGVWGTGEAHEYPFSACGIFWPLRDAASLGLSVTFSHLSGDLPLSGSARRPLFFRPPRRPPPKDGSRPPGGRGTPGLREDALSKSLFLHHGWRSLRPGCSEATERWRVLDPSGHWLLEAFDLVDSQWVTLTDIAEETDFRITASRGLPGADVEAAMAMPGPGLQPSLALPRVLDCHIISLAGARQASVDELIYRLHKASTQIRAYRSEAWDTRPLRGTELEAELVDRGVVHGEKQCQCGPILGCALSHSDLWCQFLESKRPGPWVVLEDDAVLNDIRPVASLLSAAAVSLSDSSPVGAWDIALLGCVGLPGTESLDKIGKVSEIVPGFWGPVPFFIGTWGYMISREGARRALSELWGCREGLPYDVDICLSNAGGEGRLAVSIAVPNVVLHPGVGGTAGRNVISYAGYEYYLHGTQKTATSTRYDTDQRPCRAACRRLVDRIEQRVGQFRKLLRRAPA